MLIDCLKDAAGIAREAKTEAVQSVVSPVLHAYRGEHPVAVVVLNAHERDDILMAASGAAGGFDPDVLTVFFEAFRTAGSNINPLTGQMWQQDEMQEAVENHDAIARGWVVEVLTVLAVNRALDVAQAEIPFRFITSGESLRVHFDAPVYWSSLEQPDSPPEGLFPTVLRAAMSQPPSEVAIPDQSFGRDARDVATARILQRHIGCDVGLMSVAHDSKRIAFLAEHGDLLNG
jgi:hypothetical protein